MASNDIKECSTDFGRFRIKITPDNLLVGGANYCVNIKITEKTTELYWLSTDQGGCELDGKKIKSGETIKMVDLAFSLLRKHFPNRDTITLLDDSGISWEGERHRKYKVNFLKGYLLVHGKTWYEENFNAKMQDDEIFKDYRITADKNFNDPTKKPADFYFGSASETLDPLYKSSKTWGEFIEKMVKKYNSTKYILMADWYRQAIYHIFDGKEINQNWKISLKERPLYECMKGGSSRKTLKKKDYFSKYLPIGPYYDNRA